MIRHLFLFALLVLSSYSTLFAQGFQPPPEGKAVVYFTRLSSAGFAIGFDFYDGESYIGSFAGRNYLRHETDPGEHLFWASSENFDFLTAELEPNGIYVVVVDVEMGIAVARVGLSPIDGKHRLFAKAKKLVDKKGPKTMSEEQLAPNPSRTDYIQDKLKKYDEKWKEKRTYKHLSGDMAITLNL